jgi:hypothetical protein
MLRLPQQIRVQLQDVSGRNLAAADVLIAINLLLAGRYYYGNILGLTNANGASRDHTR